MSDEEKKVIEYFKRRIANKKTAYTSIYFKIEKLDALINLIEKQSKEIEHQIEKRANQRQELAILNAKQIEFNKLVNTVNSYKGQFKRQQKEIEELKEKNKQLDFLFNDARKCLLNTVSKDKIKAKIEESKLLIDNSQGCMSDEDLYKEYGKIEFGQSLLEKE